MTQSGGWGIRFAPMLTATVITVLFLLLFKATAQVFILLFIGILLSLYLGALAGLIERRTPIRGRLALATAIFASILVVVVLGWILIPPVVAQTQQLVSSFPTYISGWEAGLNSAMARYPALAQVLGPQGGSRILNTVYGDLSGMASNIPKQVFGFVRGTIDVFAVIVMSIYLSLHPALYREWLIALFPPVHRDLVRDVLADLAVTLRSYIVGQIASMAFLGTITALGLFALNVPYWLAFGIFTGLVTIIPFFGSLLSTTIPALFVLTGQGYHGISPVGHALMVVGLGVVVHLIEGNLVTPNVMSRQVDLPPVLTIVAVLVMGEILGGAGLLVALPTLAAVMVIVRRILISRIYEGRGFRRNTRERQLVLRVPVTGGGVAMASGPPIDVISEIEKTGANGDNGQ